MAKTRLENIAYGKSQTISADGCFAISFFRPTTAPAVQVEGIDIEAGQTLSIKQNVGDEDHSVYQLTFANNQDNTNLLHVIKIMPITN
jgi:hypothetical protein